MVIQKTGKLYENKYCSCMKQNNLNKSKNSHGTYSECSEYDRSFIK